MLALSNIAPVTVALPLPSKATTIFLQIAFGPTASITVAVEVHVELLPYPSVTVKVTGTILPACAQVKLLGDTASVTAVQLSVDPLFTSEARRVAFPLPSKNTFTFPTQEAVGAKISSALTIAVHVLLLPAPSVTIKCTVAGPKVISLQSKSV